jgi:hypothetical protein
MTILLAPVAEKQSKALGKNVYRKQVLKAGQFNYKGRTIKFDRDYFLSIQQAFRDGAFDTVPFVLADKENRHTMEPERARGEVIGFEVTDDGLDAILRLSEDAVRIVEENPKFGVSARIIEGLQRGDGYTAKAAIQHVLGTWDPRMTGMSPWKAVDLSNEDHEVVDLTSGGEGEVPFTEEEIAKLRALLNEDTTAEDAPAEDETDEFVDSLTEEELEALLNEDDESKGEEKKEDAPKAEKEEELVKLSNDSGTSVELAAVRDELNAVKAELALAEWKRERIELSNQGVPPALLDAAEPLLSVPSAGAVELSNGESVDPAAVVREILSKAKGMVDLSAEMGHERSVERVDETDQWMHEQADALGL